MAEYLNAPQSLQQDKTSTFPSDLALMSSSVHLTDYKCSHLRKLYIAEYFNAPQSLQQDNFDFPLRSVHLTHYKYSHLLKPYTAISVHPGHYSRM